MSTATVNAPVRRKPGPKPGQKAGAPAVATAGFVGKSELHTEDIPQTQPKDIILPASGAIPRGEQIEALDKPITDEYAAALAFNEEPVTIMIEPGQEENAPKVIDCWVNGKGAEVLDPITGRWNEINCLPVGGIITTKRKYVEVIARAKLDKVTTKHEDANVANPDNRVVRTTSRKAVFTVIHDPNPKGVQWLTRLMAER